MSDILCPDVINSVGLVFYIGGVILLFRYGLPEDISIRPYVRSELHLCRGWASLWRPEGWRAGARAWRAALRERVVRPRPRAALVSLARRRGPRFGPLRGPSRMHWRTASGMFHPALSAIDSTAR